MKSLLKITLISVVSAFFVMNVYSASPPETINYQGYLTDSSGDPLNGTYAVLVKIYDAESGGSPVYTEIHSSVGISDGLFSILLGGEEPSSAASPWSGIDFSSALWLEITIDADKNTTVASDYL